MVLNFVCRASKARKDGLSPIELSVIINKERSIITLDRKINHKQFNPSTQKVRGDKAINDYLTTIRQKAYHIQNELIRQNNFNIHTFIHSFKYGIQKSASTILEMYEKHNTQYRKDVLCGKYEKATLYKYEKSYDRIKAYLTSIGKTDIPVRDITPSFCQGYHSYCLSSLKTSTTNKELKLFKRILQFSVNERVIDVNPFNIKIKQEKMIYEPLDVPTLEVLRDKELEGTLDRVRDMFVFQCYTGLAYCDMVSLSMDDILDGVIYKKRKKTDVQSIIPILPPAQTILEKYGYNLPIMSNQKYNVYLKALASACGIKQRLYSHLARHTFACILLNNGIDLKTISMAMGHTDSRITEQIYAEMRKETVVKNVLKGLTI
jgi:site-specific recombinase XerD